MPNPNPVPFTKTGADANPNGRPKREWTVAGLIEDALENPIEVDGKQVPTKKVVYDKLVELASKGDMLAIKEINNRLDGMPTQAIKHSGEIKGNAIVYAEFKHEADSE